MKENVKKSLWRASFSINKHLYLICSAIYFSGFIVALVSRVDWLLAITLPTWVAMGFYFLAKELENWSIRMQAPRHRAIERLESAKPSGGIKEGGEGDYEAAEFSVPSRYRLHDENHWTAKDDAELKRRIQKWTERH